MIARTALVAFALSLPGATPVTAQPAAPPQPNATMMAHAMPNATFTLRTGIADGKMVFLGRGGDIDGKPNPTLTVHEGDLVQITIINGEGAEHDIMLPDLRAASQRVSSPGASSTLIFRATDIGTFAYFCSVAGHRQAGMEGAVKVEAAQPKVAEKGVSIVRDPSDLPPPVAERGPTNIRYELEAIERVGRLDDNTTYDFWTFNGKIPGPMLRVRVGDTVTLSLKNAPDSVMMHNIGVEPDGARPGRRVDRGWAARARAVPRRRRRTTAHATRRPLSAHRRPGLREGKEPWTHLKWVLTAQRATFEYA